MPGYGIRLVSATPSQIPDLPAGISVKAKLFFSTLASCSLLFRVRHSSFRAWTPEVLNNQQLNLHLQQWLVALSNFKAGKVKSLYQLLLVAFRVDLTLFTGTLP